MRSAMGYVVPSAREGEWAGCGRRARFFLRSPGVLLSWLFGLVLGITYAATGTGGAVDWLPPGALLAAMLLLIGADNVKFWIVLYPLIFVAPRLQLGGWSEGSEQLFGLQLYEPWMLLLLAAGGLPGRSTRSADARGVR